MTFPHNTMQNEDILPKDYSIEGLIDWRPVEQAMNEQTPSGYKIAIIETHKMLEQIMIEKKFPGKTHEQRLGAVKKIMSNPEQLTYATNMYQKILHTPHFSLSLSDVKEIIAAYYQTIIEIKEFAPKKTIGLLKRLRIYNTPKNGAGIGRIKKGGITLILGIAIIYLLANTEFGQHTTGTIVTVVNILVTRILITILAVVVFIGFMLGIANNVRRKRANLENGDEGENGDNKAVRAEDEEIDEE